MAILIDPYFSVICIENCPDHATSILVLIVIVMFVKMPYYKVTATFNEKYRSAVLHDPFDTRSATGRSIRKFD